MVRILFLIRFLCIILALKLRRFHISDIRSSSTLLPAAGAFGLSSAAALSEMDRLQV
jgi:hypothetical protein